MRRRDPLSGLWFSAKRRDTVPHLCRIGSLNRPCEAKGRVAI